MIDTHIHFWRYRAADYPWISDAMPALKQDLLPEHIAPQAQALGVQAAVAVQARCDMAENDFLLQLAAEHEWVCGVVGWLDFTAADVADTLASYAGEPWMKGWRHLVQDEPNPAQYWARADFQRGVQAAQQAGFSYDLLCHQADLAAVADFARRCDGGWLVLDHLGKPQFGRPQAFAAWQEQMAQLAALPHVAVKISGLVTEYGPGATAADLYAHVDTVLELFGAGRVMWGSDWSVCALSGHDYAQVHSHWQDFRFGLSADERAAAEYGNAQRIYRLQAA
ncbi:L-fuconolactonase [Neisseria sp. HSC-16F19]|nr:amidohydrolase family protein [Neisseria sp. HSC-16F19]MCP2039878.1 L-fuconolactonase [Neisseria sp. HSC-16F19]